MCGGSSGAGYRDYRCTRPTFQDVVAPHSRRSVQATTIEPLVWQAVERVLKDPEIIAAEVARRREDTSMQQSTLDRERQSYTQQLAQCAKDLARWEAAYVAEVIDLARFKVLKGEIDRRCTGLELELARVEAQRRVLEEGELELTTLTDYCRRVAHNLRTFDLAEQRVALEALNITVTWTPDRPPDIRGSIPVAIASNTLI
jgi:hypothetical protein